MASSGYVSVLNLSAFSTSELNALLTAAKAEVLARITGRIETGSSANQSYGMRLKTDDELNRLINSVTDALGLCNQMTFVRPDFSHAGPCNGTNGNFGC